MNKGEPFDDIRIQGKNYSIKKIQKLYKKAEGRYPIGIKGTDNIWLCPECSTFYSFDPISRPKYCANCGQKIKWPRAKRKKIK